MILISHRGLCFGPDKDLENHPDTIEKTLSDFSLLTKLGQFLVEVDVRIVDGEFYLGHDKADFKVNSKFIQQDYLILHCKDLYTLSFINKYLPHLHYFFHDKDDCTLTSKNYIWTYPNPKNELYSNSIAVLPELVPEWRLKDCKGICTDYVFRYKDKF